MKSQLMDMAVPTFDIKDGDEVRDYEDDTVGRVKFVRFSDDNPYTDDVEAVEPALAVDHQANFVTAIVDPFAEDSAMPDEVRRMLLQKGYLRIERGLLMTDAFAMMDQVASVVDGVVYLNVTRDELIAF